MNANFKINISFIIFITAGVLICKCNNNYAVFVVLLVINFDNFK